MRLRFIPSLVLVGLLLASVPAQSWAQTGGGGAGGGAVGPGGDQAKTAGGSDPTSTAGASTGVNATWVPGTGGGGSDPDSWDEGTQGHYRVDLIGAGVSQIDPVTGAVDCQASSRVASFDLQLPSMVLGTTPPGPADLPSGAGGVVDVPTFAWISAGPLSGTNTSSVSWTTCNGSTPVPQTLTATMSYQPSSIAPWQWQWGDGAIVSGSPSSVLGAAGTGAIQHTYERSSFGQTFFPNKGQAYTIEFDYALDMTLTTSLNGSAASGQTFPHASRRGRVYPVRDIQSILTAP